MEGRAREFLIKRCKEEEEDRLARSFHITVLSGKLRQEVRRAINREGGGVFSQEMSTQRPGDRLQTLSGRNTLTCMYSLWKSHVCGL